MAEAERTDVLRRKARSARAEQQARVMSPARALRLSLARAADDLFGMALAVSSIHASEGGQGATEQSLGDDRLLMVLDGPGGAVGVAAADMEIVTGLIEMQTMGQVLKRKAEDRAPTQTDAALAAPLIDRMLQGFAANLEGKAAAPWAAGYRFGAMIEERRMLPLLLQAPDFHLLRVQCDLGDGAREGEIVLALPVAAPVAAERPDAGAEAGAASGAKTLEQGALMAAQAPLVAVLHRLKMPLDRISGLKAGDVLNIPREALSETRLEAGAGPGPGGQGLGKCRLGQINGMRAVRLVGAMRAPPEAGGRLVEGRDEAGAGRSGLSEPLNAPVPDDMAARADPAPVEALEALPDLPDLPDLGDLGDLSDLPELLALDE